MHVAIVSQQGRKAAGAEHALMQFVDRLPPSVNVSWFFFEDGEFASSIRSRFSSVTIVSMSQRVSSAQRGALPIGALFDGFGLVVRLAQAILKSKPDVILTNSMKAHIIGSISAKVAGVPCLNYIHDIVTDRSRALLRIISGLCAAERLTCSKAAAADLALPKTSVAYAVIDVAAFAKLPDRRASRAMLGIPNDGLPVVAMVGRIARWKGQDRFIRIAHATLKKSDAHFCIVGSPIFGCDSSYVDELRIAVSERQLDNRIRFVPWQEDMRAVYAAIDVACNCSVREPFGRTSLEALAAGVPVVCFDDAGVCEIFEQHCGATHVPAGNDDAFVAAIRAYLDDPETCRREGVQARAAATSLDAEHAFQVFSNAIARVATLRRKARPVSLTPSGSRLDTLTQPASPLAAPAIGFVSNANKQEVDECFIA